MPEIEEKFKSKKKNSAKPDSPEWALVINLMHRSGKPYIVRTCELYVLNADNEAKIFNPKHVKDFDKSKEYGRKLSLQGEMHMVRHLVLGLSGKWAVS